MIWILPWCPKVRLAAKHSHIPMQFANVVQLPYIKKCIDFTKIPAMQQTCFYNDSFFFTEEVTENSTNRNAVNDAATLKKIVTVYFVGRYASFLKEDGNKKTHFSKYVFFFSEKSSWRLFLVTMYKSCQAAHYSILVIIHIFLASMSSVFWGFQSYGYYSTSECERTDFGSLLRRKFSKLPAAAKIRIALMPARPKTWAL